MFGAALRRRSYMLYKLYSTQEVPEEEQTNCVDIALGRTALEDGLTSLDASCKAFEASLQRAVQRGDTVTANRLRSVLRRAYATMETLNSSFGCGDHLPDPRSTGSGVSPTLETPRGFTFFSVDAPTALDPLPPPCAVHARFS